MFGPNTDVLFSHRDKEFIMLKNAVTKQMKQLFNLHDFDILFIPGSGTLGMEVVISSLVDPINVYGPEEKFTDRWRSMATHYNKYGAGHGLYCRLETSISKVQSYPYPFVDAISSFPYFPILDTTRVFVTCSNKQLGAPAGLAIVGVHKDWWGKFKELDNYSYLDINNYRNNTPVTTSIEIFDSLKKNLNNTFLTNLYRQIDKVSEAFGKVFPIMGDQICPVLTIPKYAIRSELARKYQLYGYNSPTSEYYQIFTYSEPLKYYKEFLKDAISSE